MLDTRLNADISRIATSLPELVHALLAPIYQQFDFAELPQALVNNVVSEVLASK